MQNDAVHIEKTAKYSAFRGLNTYARHCAEIMSMAKMVES